jgi:hypothetical protein
MKLSTSQAPDYDYYEIFDYCIRLLGTSLYNSEERLKLEAKVEQMDVQELEVFILHLLNNQIDPINAGNNYQQGDILRKLRNERRD